MRAAASLRADSLVEGEYRLTAENFGRVAAMLRAQSGIHLPETKATLVYSRLAKRLRALGLRNFDEYCALVDSPEGADERSAMLAALTTNVTRFYREQHHFDHLRDRVLAPMAETVRRGKRLRIWSSACSTGEEPYSIALTLLSLIPDAAQHDVRILATDIDPVVIEKAKAGVYSADGVAPIPPASRERHLERVQDGRWRVKDHVRGLIAFKQLNLIGEWPMRGPFDIIFCRNVVIYFEEPTQDRIWGRFRSLLTSEGRLYIGHSERINIDGYRSDGLTIYRLDGAAS
ncbi:MAG TPA: protein-glutamate O-methyltransferase [Caulobacterales bacterium]|nr:protein-glutamate O-methyltransferase [Caulobacterales bacterium]